MKKKVTALLIGLGMLLSAGSVLAAQWLDWTTIHTMYPSYTGLKIFVYGGTGDTVCSNGSRFDLETTNPDYKVQAAMLAAAYLAKKQIHIYYEPSTSSSSCPSIISFTFRD